MNSYIPSIWLGDPHQLTREQICTLLDLYLEARAVLEDRSTPRSMTPIVQHYHKLIEDTDPLEIHEHYL